MDLKLSDDERIENYVATNISLKSNIEFKQFYF